MKQYSAMARTVGAWFLALFAGSAMHIKYPSKRGFAWGCTLRAALVSLVFGLAANLPVSAASWQKATISIDAAHIAADAAAKSLIPVVSVPLEVRAADPTKGNGKKEVAFVDTSVTDYKTLESAIRDGIEIVEIDGAQSGLAQMAAWAQGHSGYDAIHILSHGSAATLHLGADTLTAAGLATPVVQAELAEVGHALKSGGDLLVYGCDTAKGTDGQQFITDLATATGAVVAASNDTTGAAARGGNWVLEKQTGTIDVAKAINDKALLGYDGLLALPANGMQDITGTMANGTSTLAVIVHTPAFFGRAGKG